MTPIGTVILSIPQGLICSKQVAMSDMTIISIGCIMLLILKRNLNKDLDVSWDK